MEMSSLVRGRWKHHFFQLFKGNCWQSASGLDAAFPFQGCEGNNPCHMGIYSIEGPIKGQLGTLRTWAHSRAQEWSHISGYSTVMLSGNFTSDSFEKIN